MLFRSESGIAISALAVRNCSTAQRRGRDIGNREVKTVILGYIQRGGSPSANDRLLASTMGKTAIDLASSNISNRAIGIKGLSIITLPYDEAINIQKNPNLEMLELADILAK